MNYLSVAEIAKKWNISERSVRNYCSQGRVDGAILICNYILGGYAIYGGYI